MLISCNNKPVQHSASNIKKPSNNPLVDSQKPSEQIYLKGKRYEERELEQQSLRRALSHLEFFDGDGQLRVLSGGYNGSIFWFSPRVLMTNEHVIASVQKDDLEYIAFPRVVFYKNNLLDKVKNYIKIRLERENNNIKIGKQVLKDRIQNLQQKSVRTEREQTILQAYLRDQELLNKYKPLSMADKIFIPIETAVEKLWTPTQKTPDIALIILKKPIQQLLKDAGSSLKISEQNFAESNLWDPLKHGWIYEGTPVYSAGYGRKPEDDVIDKDKSLVARRLKFFQPNTFNQDSLSPHFSWDSWPLEKEFYFYEPNTSGPGSSGSRLFVYVDKNGIISSQPGSLDRKQVTLGIHTGDPHVFNREDSIELLSELIKYSPYVQNKGVNSFPVIKKADSSALDYLFLLKNPIPPKLAEGLMWQTIYHIILANRRYDSESSFLWLVVLNKLAETFKLNEKEYLDFVGSYLSAHALMFSDKDFPSPSEMSDQDINSYVLASNLMSGHDKDLYKKMIENKLFDEFKDYEINFTNINKPVKIDAYLQALAAWVKNKKYSRNLYIDTPIKVPDTGKTYADIQELVKTFTLQ